ncbi:ExbD/TolR family protein [Longitalea arenae]|uniref:ExbD/TolR family protein n=1 Tax=Longitalea arenae TaxID=2812558 RepID=UPI001967E441|nr:biopolymer transporter ExbD [Longitalea arenae]
MAEINIPGATGDKPGVRRSRKLSTKVDLTPMVDLGFLLITFFIFTTTMSDPRVTDLIMPKDSKDSMNVGLSNALTVIPLKDNKVFYYHGELGDALTNNTYGITNYSVREGLGEIVRNKQAALDRVKPGNRKELLLMIKPTPESNYENLVNVLDEVLINGVKRYAIMDISPYEQELAVNKSSKN